MKEQVIEQSALDALRGYLEKVPFVQIDRIVRTAPGGVGDIEVWLRFRDRSFLLLIEVKNNGQPRLARQAVYELRHSLKDQGDAYGVFIAPYISPRAGAICEDAGIGYLDLAGNCLLSFDTVYIRQVGAPNPDIQRRFLRTVYSPKAERVLRALLIEPRRTWKITEMSLVAGVSLGQVANVKKLLLDREWLNISPDGMRLADPAALLDEWAQAYSFQRNKVQDFYALAELPDVEAQLADTCQQMGVQYALNGFSSAARIAPMVRYQKASAYVNGDIDALVKRLGWKAVASGANVSLLIPYDGGVFYGVNNVDEIAITAPVQTYLDLQNYRGRGQEAAEAVRREMENTW